MFQKSFIQTMNFKHSPPHQIYFDYLGFSENAHGINFIQIKNK